MKKERKERKMKMKRMAVKRTAGKPCSEMELKREETILRNALWRKTIGTLPWIPCKRSSGIANCLGEIRGTEAAPKTAMRRLH